ncbi:beta-amylase 7 isoform X3 [Punica granatum]|uniref:Beta-amylase n=1 Tax=Punica granatum TaxID=22663 RepID=A0A6P8DKP0_PUNGR|nr:beta-amylase 7 isoform X3 [Punica granatum]
MATDLQKLIGASEEDEDEDMDVKEEDDDDEDAIEKHLSTSPIVGVDVLIGSTSNSNRFHSYSQMQEQVGNSGGGSRRCRPLEEKERTKLRERHRRAITARILAGLRRHGNYNLRVRADINDVIAALAREAGWVVLPDGTTYPSRSQASRPVSGPSMVDTSPSSQMMIPQQTTPISPRAMVGDGEQTGGQALIGCSIDTLDGKQIVDIPLKLSERDFAGTAYIPVFVMLPLGVINLKCELADPDGLLKQLMILKTINVDGVSVNCWWGIVEAHAPQEYNWNGYRRLFQMIRELNLKLQIVMSFHACGGNVGDDVCIPLPHWVAEIGRSNPDIYFTDREGRRNPESLSWGVDKERVLKGRTAIEVYFDYMRSFRVEFNEYFEDGIISMIEVGLGPCGELRYPSSPVKHGWRYPGIGAFQCWDQYMLKSLRKAADERGQAFWARGPDNVGSYNSQPQETGFFCEGGDYDGYYGRFFLGWYSQMMIDHGDRILSMAKLAFEGTCIAAKLSGIHWWYRTASHAAELTTGYYNPSNKDGYAAIAAMLKKHGAAMNFPCLHSPSPDQPEEFQLTEALADPNGLTWQVMNAAWDVCLPMVSENSIPCFDWASYSRLLNRAKPLNDPEGRHFLAFTYLRLNPLLLERHNFMEFERFLNRMHGVLSLFSGEAIVDIKQ